MTRRRRQRSAPPWRPRPSERFFATAAKGTERLLAEELAELGLPGVRAERGGVYFGEKPADAYRACLWSRIALRVVEAVASFDCESGDDLYEGVRSFDWSPFFGAPASGSLPGAGAGPPRTLAVRAVGQSEQLTHTHFIALRTKDAIVDQLRERDGTRPSVDRDDPDVLVFVHLARGHATVHLDYSGRSLHARGFRSEAGAAPLRETLAAALVRFSGWRGDTPLTDPMCGSGTLLLEAAGWAGRRAPGLVRAPFGFERWGTFDASAARTFAELKQEARALARPIPELFGSDTDARALEQARAQAARAGVHVRLQQVPLARLEPPPPPGALLMNPPYGQRLARSAELERDVGQALERCAAYQCAVIVPKDFPVQRRASRWLAVYNGALECELRRYDAAGAAAAPDQ